MFLLLCLASIYHPVYIQDLPFTQKWHVIPIAVEHCRILFYMLPTMQDCTETSSINLLEICFLRPEVLNLDTNVLIMGALNPRVGNSWLGPELFWLLLGPPGFNSWVSFAPVFQWCCSTSQGSPGVGRNTLLLSSPHLCFIIVLILDLFPVMIHWWIRKPLRGPNN